MKRILKIIVTLLAIGALGFGGFEGYQYVQQRSKPAAQREKQQAVRVRIAVVQTQAIEDALVLTGEIKATALVEVKPKLSGRLERLSLENGTPVAEGTLVRKDEVIAVLEHKDLKAQVDEATAAVKTAQAAVETAKASIASAQAGVDAAEIIVANEKRDKERVDNLFNKGVLTENERDQATTEYDRAVADKVRYEAELTANRARRIQAEALVNQAKAALQLAEITYREAFLKSPLTGVVCAKYVDPGAMVGPTTAVVCVQPMSELKFVVAVPGEILPKIDPNKTVVTIGVAAYPGHQFRSRISKVYPVIDPVTRTATVEIVVENEQNKKGEYLLLPGMYATARLVVERKEKAVVVPADALIRRIDKYFVFVVQNGVARSRSVKVGMRSGEFLEILEGLSAGEELVASGQHRLTDGTPVERVQTGSTGGEQE